MTRQPKPYDAHGPPAKISLVLADVDGTLLTPQKLLSARARQAALAVQTAGIHFAITSGRPPYGLRMLIEPLRLQTPIAGFNGGIYVQPDMSVIESHALAPKAAETAVAHILDAGLDAWIYTAEGWLVRDPQAPHVEMEAATIQSAACVVPQFRASMLQNAIKVVGVSDNLDAIARCEQTLQDHLTDTANAARSQPYYLDVTHPLATKGMVVRRLAAMLGVPSAEIACIGDMPNDIPMFAESGFAIAMGNADASVKDNADAVTDSNEQDGFAQAMERFILSTARGWHAR